MLLLAGCGDRPPFFDEPQVFHAEATLLGTQVVFINQTSHVAHRLDLADPQPRTERVDLPLEPRLSVHRATSAADATEELLVVCAGGPARAGSAPLPAELAVLGVEGNTPRARYEIAAPFDAIEQSHDGRYALLYFRGVSGGGQLLFNRNEIAIVDLQQQPSEDNPHRRTLRSFGEAPRRVVFSPGMTIAGTTRTLAVVLFDSYVTLLDLETLSEHTVQLTTAGNPSLPEQVLFGVDDARIYVRGNQSNDAYALQLHEDPESARGDFRVSINQVGAGRTPSDMGLYRSPEGAQLLVLSPGSNDLWVIDAASSRSTRVALETAASRLLMLDDGRDSGKPEALLYGNGSVWLSFLSLQQIESRKGRNLETLRLAAPVERVVPMLERGVVLLVHHSSQGPAPALSLLRVQDRTVAPIDAHLDLAQTSFHTDEARLWVGAKGQRQLGMLDLDSFHAQQVELDASIAQVLLSPAAATVAVVHNTFGGHLTLLDRMEPARGEAIALRGFLLADLLRGPDTAIELDAKRGMP
ncbi:MAG: hypothetical protein MJD61_00170 [Proteobacteria bacterium]|nr:hypothetical protein [Pseudomonadota bacterium]